MNPLALAANIASSGSAAWIRKTWDRLEGLPKGKQLYSRLLGRLIPYTGSIKPEIKQLERGFARVEMRDRRAVRNHLDCIHAIALSNLAELTGNAALAYSLPDDARFIVSSLTTRYLKKARGTISATCHCSPHLTNEKREIDLEVQLHDSSDELVAEATLRTLIGPIKRAS